MAVNVTVTVQAKRAGNFNFKIACVEWACPDCKKYFVLRRKYHGGGPAMLRRLEFAMAFKRKKHLGPMTGYPECTKRK